MDSDDEVFGDISGIKEEDFKGVIEEEEEEPAAEALSAGFNLSQLEIWILLSQKDKVQKLYKALQQKPNDPMFSAPSAEERMLLASIIRMSWLVNSGRYADVLRLPLSLEVLGPCDPAAAAEKSVTGVLTLRVEHFLSIGTTPRAQSYRAFILLLIAVCCLNLFLQANYTGPSFSDEALRGVYPLPFYKDIDPAFAKLLEAQKPEEAKAQLHSQTLLSLQARTQIRPEEVKKETNLSQETANAIHMLTAVDDEINEKTMAIERNRDGALPTQKFSSHDLRTVTWWSARAVSCHNSLLLAKERSETLWAEAQRLFEGTSSFFLSEKAGGSLGLDEKDYALLKARLWLEWGLAESNFNERNKGKRSFEKALESSGLKVKMTGAMGKRTKYQVKETAQMVLWAASKYEPESSTSAAAEATAKMALPNAPEGLGTDVVSIKVNVPTVKPEGEGVELDIENATLRTVNLDQANPDNILLEKLDIQDVELSAQGNLQKIDQAILLALCLDVKNHNPAHGLTNEQMTPYVVRVLENPNNWMIYSTGLLEKSWLEYERSHSRERAVLQLQALVDQHTNRLTITQNSLQAIEESAPAEERLEFIHCLAFPPRWELRKGLADRYAGLRILRSALEIYEDLGMWDEVVECYSLLEQKKKAEEIVRERLHLSPTPYMLCALGDLTENPQYYEEAWKLSGGHYARAKRSLGFYYFNKGDDKEGIKHLMEALSINPNFPRTWFTVGVMAMRGEEDWNLGVRAFTRVIQLEPDTQEAWGNIGSIHLRLGHYDSAFAAFQEGLKLRRENWRMWENFLMCAMENRKYGDAIHAMHNLLELRNKHKKGVDMEYLAILVEEIAGGVVVSTSASDQRLEQTSDQDDDAVRAAADQVRKYQIRKLGDLLREITTTTNDWKVWQVFARYYEVQNNLEEVVDCRTKQLRALQTAGWEKDLKRMELVSKAACQLAKERMELKGERDGEGQREAYAVKLQLRGLLKKIEQDYSTTEAYHRLQRTLQEVESKFP